MLKISIFFKKFTLAFLTLIMGLIAFPTASVFAAGNQPQTPVTASQTANNLRLELVWERAQLAYQRQGWLLERAAAIIARAQDLIDLANQKGWDTSAVQSALNAFRAVIPAVETAHLPGATIIAVHAGFSPSGNVTDRATAIETVRSLVQVLKDTRTALNGTGRALRSAIQAFRNAHQPVQAPANQ